MIKVRFAPSPTGFLHIGGARTALFNWMYARAQAGKFVLRIEDTDLVRSKQEYYDEILDSMKWLGLNWDELYKQSERFSIYAEYAQKLLAEDKAYKEGEAILLKMPQQEIKVFDLIRGEISFDTATLKDEVLMKSDGSPTYSFACVVDDALMEISHVIRGEDHISNTPKQLIIYQALNFKVPKFAHLPLIMDEAGGRLSKRFGAVAVTDYRRQGFLPEALVNYLMLLGWSPGGDQEMISISSAVKKFSIKKVNKSAAAFSLEKLKSINTAYIKQKKSQELTDLLIPFLKEQSYIGEDYDRNWLEVVVKLFQRRLPTLVDFLSRADYLFKEDYDIEPDAIKQYLEQDFSREFESLASRIEELDAYNEKNIEQAFRGLVEELQIEASQLVHPLRVALTGKAVGIGLFETMALLGKVKTVQRLRSTFKK